LAGLTYRTRSPRPRTEAATSADPRVSHPPSSRLLFASIKPDALAGHHLRRIFLQLLPQGCLLPWLVVQRCFTRSLQRGFCRFCAAPSGCVGNDGGWGATMLRVFRQMKDRYIRSERSKTVANFTASAEHLRRSSVFGLRNSPLVTDRRSPGSLPSRSYGSPANGTGGKVIGYNCSNLVDSKNTLLLDAFAHPC